MSFEIGSQIFDYEVIGVLGTGGMGKVYKVRNVISDRIDAMKVLLPDLTDQPELADRFLREIKVLASLSHRNIAAFHTALRFENQLIMVMELVHGIPLNEKLLQGRIPLNDGLAYTTQVLCALGYAHGQGVIHRDIKPANIMLAPEGSIKLMDFGIAKTAADPRITRTGTTVGSLYYISPEALTGGTLDARSDLYSLGVTMYEIVTGKRPFEGKSEYSLMAAHLREAPRPPVELDPSLPASLNAVILKALAKNPDDRFQSADEFRAALKPAAGLALKASPAPDRAAGAQAAALPGSPPSHRGRYMLLGALAAIILIIASTTELPRWFRARATGRSEPRAAAQTTPSSASQALAPPAPINASGTPASPQPSSALPEATSDGKVKSNPAAHPARVVSRQAMQGQGIERGHAVQQQAARQPAKQQLSSPSPSTIQRGASDLSSQDAAALQALEDRMSQLSGRANAVKTTVDNLQQQEVSSGLSLRPDVLASESRMERYMDQADAAFSSHNPSAAKHNMELAEKEITTLERFVGR